MRKYSESALGHERWPQDYVASYAKQLSRAIPGRKPKENSRIVASTKPRQRKATSSELPRLMKVPVDVVLEIAGHTHPRAVLSLARASKYFREILMSNRSRRAWRAARESIGLPDCPRDLSEPEFIHLVFSTDCQICGAHYILKADYLLKLRLCKDCLSANVKPGHIIVKEINVDLENNPDVYNFTPCQDARKYLRKVNDTLVYTGGNEALYFKPALADTLEKYVAIRRDSEKGEARFFAFARMRYNSIVSSISLADRMELWIEAEKEAAKAKHQEHRIVRQRIILHRIHALGYTDSDIPKKCRDEVENNLLKQWNEHFNKGQELDERTWKLLLPKLKNILKKTKECRDQIVRERNRLDREWRACRLYEAYLDANVSDTDRALTPNSWDLLTLSPIKTLIDQNEHSNVVTEESWLPVLDTILQSGFFSDYREKVLEVCESRIIAACPSTQDDIHHDSHLTTLAYVMVGESFGFTTFTGRLSPKPLLDVLLERAKTKYEYDHRPRKGSLQEVSFPKSIWDVEKLHFDAGVITAARTLLSVCGMSTRTPMADLTKYGKRLLCLRCPTECRKPMTWADMACHYAEEIKNYQKAEIMKEEIGKGKIFKRGNRSVTEEPYCLTFMNTHDLKDNSPVIDFPPDSEQEVEPGDRDRHEYKRVTCNICSFADIIHHFDRKTELEAHIRAIHAKEPEPRDWKV